MRTNKIEAQDPRISFVVINANDDFMCSVKVLLTAVSN